MASPPGVPADPLDPLTRRRTSTRPPHPPYPTPCPYRTAYVSCCIRSSTFIRWPGYFVNVHNRPLRYSRVILSKWIIGTYSCNGLAGHAVSLDYHLLLDYIGQRLGGVLDGDEVGVAGTVPYYVEPEAFGVAARL